MGWKTVTVLAFGPCFQRSRRIHCCARPYATCALPTTGTLFSAEQATTQAWRPVQSSESTAMPHRYSGYLTTWYMLGWLAPSGALPRSSISRAAASPTTSTISRLSSSKVARGQPPPPDVPQVVVAEGALRDRERPPRPGLGEVHLHGQMRQPARRSLR